MPYANTNGQRIYFEDSGGSGPPVVLAHGFLMDHTMFDAQVAALAPAFRVIRWDERCFGKTEEDGRPFTYWDSAADCLGLLDHLGIERAILGGMSQGGFLSLRAALRAPGRVKGLVLISTQAGVEDEATLAGHRQMLDQWTTLGPVDALVEALAGLILGPREHWEPWTSRWRAERRERFALAGRCLIERDDVTGRIGEISCPAIVIHGDADQALPLQRALALHEGLPGRTRFVEVKGAAHAANLTHPDQVNPPLVEFLRAHA
jgi:pimeloyl-ACP methyl ester carboxylesterase